MRENTLLRHGGCPPSPSPETRPIQFLGRQLGTRFLCRLRIRLDKKLSVFFILFPSVSLSLSLEPNRTIREYRRQRERGEGWILESKPVKIHDSTRRQIRDRKNVFFFFSVRYYRPRFERVSVKIDRVEIGCTRDAISRANGETTRFLLFN